jgi:hypothetical protein
MFHKLSAWNRANDRILQRLAHFALKGRGQDNNNNAPDVDSANQDENAMNFIDANSNASADTTLSKCPRDLHVLWEEYEHGLEGHKTA